MFTAAQRVETTLAPVDKWINKMWYIKKNTLQGILFNHGHEVQISATACVNHKNMI